MQPPLHGLPEKTKTVILHGEKMYAIIRYQPTKYMVRWVKKASSLKKLLYARTAHTVRQKASADLIVMAYRDTYKMPVTITRCSNNYGPYHFPGKKLIPLIIKKVSLKEKRLPVLWKRYKPYATGYM